MGGDGLSAFHPRMDAPVFTPFHSSPQSSNPNSASTTDGPTLGSSPHQSPNSQLKMSLLNNLIQMQGLGNSVAQQQVTGSMSQSTLSSSPSSSSNQGCSSTTNTAPASSSSPLRIPRTTRRFSSSRSSFLSCSSF